MDDKTLTYCWTHIYLWNELIEQLLSLISEVSTYNRPYAHDIICEGRPRLEVKRRLFNGQSCAVCVQICAFWLFHHRFTSKMAAWWRQCRRSIPTRFCNCKFLYHTAGHRMNSLHGRCRNLTSPQIVLINYHLFKVCIIEKNRAYPFRSETQVHYIIQAV